VGRRIRQSLTYANVMATVAVFLALGGVSYAAFTLPAKSVGSKQLKRHAVTPRKVAPATVKLFKGERGAQGATGLRGETGPQGPEGDTGPLGRIAKASNETLVGGFPFSTLRTVTITAPADGFIRLDGSVFAWDNNASTHCSDCELALRIHDVTASDNSSRSFFIGGAGSHVSGIEVPVSWVFPVTAGTRSYTLDAGEVDFSGGPLTLENPTLIAQFVPFGGTGTTTSLGVSSATTSSPKARIGR
jgi:hypothetical protein